MVIQEVMSLYDSPGKLFIYQIFLLNLRRRVAHLVERCLRGCALQCLKPVKLHSQKGYV